jgi:hypothetical protein
MRIMIFTEGTIIMHRDAVGFPRDTIVRQVQENEGSVNDFASYVPIGASAEKLSGWAREGAQIMYLTSRTKPNEIQSVRNILDRHGFPAGRLAFRQGDEEYKDIAEKIVPDVLIEDDCESIGGAEEMTITHVDASIRRRIKSISVREFGGIDHLPSRISALLEY